MATYEEVYFKDAAFYHPTGGGPLAGRTTSRVLANGDVVKLHKVERDTKIADAVLSVPILDAHATPTATGQLELTDGSTTVALVAVSTALAATGGIARLSNAAALGYVVPSRGFWLQFRMLTAVATAPSAGVIGFAVNRTNVLSGAESPLAPTG